MIFFDVGTDRDEDVQNNLIKGRPLDERNTLNFVHFVF